MTLTDGFIVLWLFVLFCYEMWTLRNKTKNDTISHRVVTFCRRHPWFALLLLLFVVLLAGHWFMPEETYWPWRQTIFVD